MKTFTLPSFAALLRHDGHPHAPAHFQILQGLKWYGVGCQIRRQAGHGAAHSLATYLEAAELIPRLAAVNADTFFDVQLPFVTDTHTHTHSGGYRKCPPSNAHVPILSPKPHPRAPPPDPR